MRQFKFSLHSVFLWLTALSLLLVLLTFAALARLSAAADRVIEVDGNLHHSYLLADMLRQSSDDLTRLARTYAVTGDPQFEKQYWDVLAIRNGNKPMPEAYHRIYWDLVAAGQTQPRPAGQKASLRQLMKEAGFTEVEFAKLDEAVEKSDTLVRLETIAINAVKGQFDDGKGGFTRHGRPDLELAQRLMHDANYHAEKAKIMQPIDEFFAMMELRTQNTVQTATQDRETARNQVWATILFNFFGVALGLRLAYQHLLKVLGGEPATATEAVQRVANGDMRELTLNKRVRSNSLLGHLKTMQHKLGLALADVKSASGAVHRGTQDIKASIMQQAASSSQMSASVSEITATMEEMSVTSSQIAEHAKSVVDLAEQGWHNSRDCLQAIEEVQSRMAGIRAQSEHGTEEIIALGVKSKQIGKVMEIINDIAGQTRLIAFNAALEASSAGDAGRRFSVVASEIRRLADSVTSSTQEIAEEINAIQDSIERLVLTSEKGVASIAEGIQATGTATQRLEAMVTATSRTNEAALQISLSTQQQKTANSQILTALREIMQASGNTSDSIQSISKVSQHLSGLAASLNEAVANFEHDPHPESALANQRA